MSIDDSDSKSLHSKFSTHNFVEPPYRVAENRAAMSTLPATIFKYESLSLQSLKNFKAQSVFFASPLNFNDPYDCAITAVVEEPTAEDVEALSRHFAGRADAPEEIKTLFGVAHPTVIKEMFMKSTLHNIDDQRKKFLETKGVCCFSEVNDNLLMCAHYGGCYQGMCLEFRTKYPPFSEIRRVAYKDVMPKINIRRLTMEGDLNQSFEMAS